MKRSSLYRGVSRGKLLRTNTDIKVTVLSDIKAAVFFCCPHYSSHVHLLVSGRHLNHMITPLLNHQFESVHIRSEPISICIRQTGLGVNTTNLVSHLVHAFECELMRITFAGVDRPLI